MPIDLSPYLPFELEHVHPRIAAWMTRDVILRQLAEELAEDLAWLMEEERAAYYREQCPVPDTLPTDYMPRELDLGLHGRAIAGIHFAGTTKQPFVAVYCRTQPLATTEAVGRVGAQLKREFAPFAPRRFRLWVSAADTALESVAGAEVGMCVLAGRLDELLARPERATKVEVALVPCRSAEVYAEYLAMYERLFALHPEWRGRIQVETAARLDEAQEQGVLARALVEGESAGFFAAVPARERALAGFVMLEELLDSRFRGRGLAPTLQRMLFDHLAPLRPPESTVIFGHIEHANVASLRTARAVGREEVYRTLYLPLV